jgi:hypothetical protein
MKTDNGQVEKNEEDNKVEEGFMEENAGEDNWII